MIEFAVCSGLLLAFCVLVSRRGHRHLLLRGLPWAMLAAGALAGVLLETLPFTAFRAGPSWQTAVAAVCGLLAGRLGYRGAQGWARGQERDVAAGHAHADGRLMHPLLGMGLWLSGTAIVWALATARHEALEVLSQPRDPDTLIVRGAEEVSIEGDPALSHAVLLVHGFLGSPADFGDLPQALRAKGFAVRAIRLPHHGLMPSSLVDADPAEYVKAVDDARTDLAKTHAKVSVVGFSVGGALALHSAKAAPPHRLVLVNPWLGELATPSWCPIATDALLPIVAKITRRVIPPPGTTRCNDPEGLLRQRAYRTVLLGPVAETTDFLRRGPLDAPACPTLLLLSREDRTVPSARAEAWFRAAAVPPTREQILFERSDHLLFLDHDRDAAAAALASWLLTSR